MHPSSRIATVTGDDITFGPSGIRGQALSRAGDLVDDFVFDSAPSVIHVRNAPSPAATASLAIGAWIAREVEQAGDVGAAADPARGASDPTDD